MNTLITRLAGLSINSLKKTLPLVVVMFISGSSAFAVGKTWTGASGTAWNNANNWSPVGVPASGDDVSIGTQSNYPIITTTVSIRDLVITDWGGNGVTLTVNTGANLTVTRTLEVLGSAQFIQNAGTFTHSGTGLTVSGDAVFTINGGTFNTSAAPFTGGSLTAGTATINFNAGLTIGSGKTYTLGRTKMLVQGNFTMNNSNSVFRAGKDTVRINGRLSSQGNTFYGDTSVIIVNGNGTNTISGNFYTNAAKITFNPTSFTNIGSGGRFYVNTGTVLFNDSVYVGSNGQLHGGDGTVSFSKSLAISSDGQVNNTSGTINFLGNATVNSSGTINGGSGQLNFSGNVSVYSSGVINGGSADLNIEGDVVFQNSGTLNAGSGTLVIGGDVEIQNSNGTFNANTSTLYIAGDLNNIGTFNAGTSTVVLNGTGTQAISTDIVFYNLQIQTDGTVSAGGNVTVLNGGIIGANTTISIPDANDQFEVNGDLIDSSGALAVATNKPFVTSILVNSSTEIVVFFNETVTQATVENAVNSTWSGRTISSRVKIDSNQLRIIFTPAITFNTEYTLVFQNISNTRNPVGTMSPNHEKRFTWTQPNAPSTASTNMTFTNVTTDSMTVRWTKGNGAERIVLMRRDSAVSFVPFNGTEYTANATYAAGTNLGNAQYTVYKGTGDSIRVKGLSTGNTYYFKVIEYNGNLVTAVYQSSGLSGSRTTPFVAPTVAATNMTFSTVTSDSMTVRWTNGNGTKRVVFMRKDSAVSFAAANGTEYTANATYGSGTNLGNGQYAVYQGTGDSIRVKGLLAGSTYYFRVVEYKGTAANTVYQTISPLNGSRLTPYTGPSTAATSMTFTTVSKDSMTVRWVNGNGSRRIVLMRRDSAVSFAPVNGTEYTANATYAAGTNLGNGQYTVYQGTGDSIRVKGLSAGVTYYFRVVEYNGTAANAVYQTVSPLSGSRLTPYAAPSAAATSMTFTTVSKDSMTVRWVNGNGSRRIVLMRRDSAVSFAPVNGTEYTANATYAAGTNLGNGQYTVYQGTGDSIRVKGLSAGVTYYFRVVEYNGTAANTVYQTVSPLSGSRIAPFIAPSSAATTMSFTTVTSDSMTVRWVNGNGSRRIVLMRRDSAVSFAAVNGTEYTANATYAAGTNLGNGQYAVYQGTGDSIRVKGLSAGVTYYFRVVEYNGTATNTVYQTVSPLSGSRTATFSRPTTQPSSFMTGVTSDTTIGLSWTSGNGSYRIVLARESIAVNGTPLNNTAYTGNSNFGLGSEIGNGNYVVYAGNGNNVTVTGLAENKTYYFAIMEFNGSGESQSYLTTGVPTIGKNTQVRVDVKVFLEGPFNGTDMTPAINSVVPNSQVYNSAPWNYNGSETVNGMPVNNVVDWVLIELREATSAGQAAQGAIVGRRAGLLLSTGKVVDLDGVSPLLVSTTRSGRLFVVVYHRTHVAIESNDSLTRSTKKHVYDFTTVQTAAYGSAAQKEVATGVYAMYCGRFALSTTQSISMNDMVESWNQRNAIGYYPGDVNMDGVVDAIDRSLIWNNRGTSTSVAE